MDEKLIDAFSFEFYWDKFKNVEFMHCKSLRNVFEKYWHTRRLRVWFRIIFSLNRGGILLEKVFEIKDAVGKGVGGVQSQFFGSIPDFS